MQSRSISADKPNVRQLFSYPFRIFFLSLGLFAVLIVPLWVAVITGMIQLPSALPGIFWHQHEMLFGFLPAAIAGFLLTAVCVWTKTDRLHGRWLLGFWFVWLAGRVLMAVGGNLPEVLVQGINLAFLPLVMLDAGWRIWRARQPRHAVILLVLGLLWTMQIGFVLTTSSAFIEGGLVMAMALAGIIGGRITPAFTAGWLRQQGRDASAIRTIPRLDLLSLVSFIALLLLLLTGFEVATGIVALIAAGLMLARLAAWRGWHAIDNPLLWILHISLLWIPVSLILRAGAMLWGWPSNGWSHAVGLGVIGSLVLGVIARVSLGHTGRALVLPGGMLVAFFAIQVAAVVRVTTAFGGIGWEFGIDLSASLWVLAFLLYVVCYTGILMRPRADGREG